MRITQLLNSEHRAFELPNYSITQFLNSEQRNCRVRRNLEHKGLIQMATVTLPEAEVKETKTSNKQAATKYVFSFGGGKADGNGKMKDVLGGKGAGLAEMTNAGLPVPPGFTIQTEACREYMRGGLSADVDRQMDEALAKLEALQGQKLGTGENPLLVSVRSGAKFSMPGMMDTILNLGLNDKSVEALAKRSNNPRFAADSY